MPTTERLIDTIAMLSSIEIARTERLSHTTGNTLSIFVVRREAMGVVSLAASSPRLLGSEFLDGIINSSSIVSCMSMLLGDLMVTAINERR